jgi:hypothetical protein
MKIQYQNPRDDDDPRYHARWRNSRSAILINDDDGLCHPATPATLPYYTQSSLSIITGAAGWFFYRLLAFLTERYRLARGTLQLPILGDRDRSKSAHAFVVGAVRWHQQAIRARLICIPIAYNRLPFLARAQLRVHLPGPHPGEGGVNPTVAFFKRMDDIVVTPTDHAYQSIVLTPREIPSS